jgi:hypothetical protein
VKKRQTIERRRVYNIMKEKETQKKEAVSEETKEGIDKNEREDNKYGKKDRDLEITVKCFKILTVQALSV